MSNRKFAKAVLECDQTIEERIEHIVIILSELGGKMLDVREESGQPYDEAQLLIGLSMELQKIAPDLKENYSLKISHVMKSPETLKHVIYVRLQKKASVERYTYDVGYDISPDDYISFVRFDRDGDTDELVRRQAITPEEMRRIYGMDTPYEPIQPITVRERYGAGLLQADSVIAVPRVSSTDSGLIRGIGARSMIVDEAQYLSESELESELEGLRERMVRATGVPDVYVNMHHTSLERDRYERLTDRIDALTQRMVGDIGI